MKAKIKTTTTKTKKFLEPVLSVAKALVFITLFIFAGTGFAQDIWIEAVGINSKLPSQNLDEFYQAAAHFESVCKNSLRHPECHLFLNDDSTLVGKYAKVTHPQINEGTATSVKVIQAFKSAIERAKDSDTVILSLDDHGSPSPTFDGSSCIYLDEGDFICDSDLGEIIKKKKKGAHVLVVADGCYSGAFANVAKYGACAVTEANQLHFADGGQPSFWKLVEQSRASKLFEIEAPLGWGFGRRLSSQAIIQTMCSSARIKASLLDAVSSAVSSLGSLSQIDRPPVCSLGVKDKINNGEDPLKGLIESLPKAEAALTMVSCEALSLPTAVCDAKKRLEKTTAVQIQSLLVLQKLTEHYNNIADQLSTFISDHMSGIDPNIQRAVEYVLFFGGSRDFYNDSPPQMLDAFNKAVDKLTPIKNELMSEQTATDLELHKVYNALRGTQEFQDWMSIRSCLNDIPEKDEEKASLFLNATAGTPQQVTDYWDAVAKKNVPMNFSASDLRGAQECESQIRF